MNKFIGLKQGSAEWLLKRSKILTATNISTILNYNVYESRIKLLQRKISGEIQSINNKAVDHGNKYEDIARLVYEEKTNQSVFVPGLIMHPNIEYLGASPDGIVEDSHLVEFKCYYSHGITDSIPINYWVQMQIQMEVCGYDKCDLVECIFKEYKNKEEYEKDSIFKKGILTLDNIDSYWKLVDFKITQVNRDIEWYLSNFKTIEKFWKSVEYYKINKIQNKRELDSDILKVEDNNIDFSKMYNYQKIDNYIMNDSIIDYLELFSNKYRYGLSKFQKMNKERKCLFTHQIMNCFGNKTIIMQPEEIISNEKVLETKAAIQSKKPVIFGGILIDLNSNIYCRYDCLILGKHIPKIDNYTFIPEVYYNIQILNKTITTYKHTIKITNNSDCRKYKARSVLLNNLLNKEQSNINTHLSLIIDKSFNTLNDFIIVNLLDDNIIETVSNGLIFYKNIVENKDTIDIYNPTESSIKLIPNMKNDNHSWSSVKNKIANKINPITLILNCGISQQNNCIENGIYSFTDEKLTTSILFNKKKMNELIKSQINQIIHINKKDSVELLSCSSSIKDIIDLQSQCKYEFYVDFETTRLIDDTEVLYLIGMGVSINSNWEFYSFVLDINNPNGEKEMVIEWIHKMISIRTINNVANKYKIWHWSDAEPAILKRIISKYTAFIIPKLEWKDLREIFTKEQIVIKGAYNYKLKSIVNSMYKHGFITSNYNNVECTSGVDALVDGYECYSSAKRMELPLAYYLTEKSIIEYNRLDCYSLYEIVQYMRTV